MPREEQPVSEAAAAVIAGQNAVARSAFGEGLRAFRVVLDQEPALFLRSPELLTDLGRSFQFASAGSEGADLFRDWEAQIRNGTMVGGEDTRYRLLYFAGRIDRQRGNHQPAAAAFAQALDLAPDERQADACIWYILNINFQTKPDEMLPLLKTYIPRMKQASYFEDIMDRLARHLAAKRQWRTLREVYELLPPQAGGSARAQYAYILGRAAEAGYIAEKAEDFFRAAREEQRASFYYRALAAHRLGTNPVTIPGRPVENPVPPAQRKLKDFSHPAEMEFLLGFFQYGAGNLAWPYIQDRQEGLSIPELRTLAEALQADGQWDTSLRLIPAYMEREDYRETRADLELYFPRPYRDLVERYGEEADIPPYLLYGLIRAESAFMPGISSRVGASGLTQLMPDTAGEMADRIKRQGGPDYRVEGDINLQDPEVNIHLGSVYLRYLMDRLENPLLALLAYNGGYTRVRRWRAAAPDLPADLLTETIEYNETREYGRRVMGAAAVYGYLYYNVTMEAVLADIFR
jgi:soluble lytic murein transglycosylase